jgi:hypothetical protein
MQMGKDSYMNIDDNSMGAGPSMGMDESRA